MPNHGKGIDPNWEPASQLELDFAQLWVDTFPEIDLYTEHQFDPSRKFRFDFCSKVAKVAIELQGGIWVEGGHSTGSGISRDYEKMNLAQSQGWQVFLLTADNYHDLGQLAAIARCVELRLPTQEAA